MKKKIQDSLCPGQDSTWALEYESEGLVHEPTFPVHAGICKAMYSFFFAHHHFNPLFLRLGNLARKQITVKHGFLCSLNFRFPTFYTRFFISPTKTSICYIFLLYTFVPFTQFLIYTFNLSINCPVAVALCTFNWKSLKTWVSIIIFCFFYCLCVPLLFYGFKVMPAEHSYISYQCQALLVANVVWCTL